MCQLYWHQAYPNNLSYEQNEITRALGAVSIRKTVLPGMAIPMLKIRRPNGRLIFNMDMPYVDKTVFILRRGPGYLRIIALSLGHRGHHIAGQTACSELSSAIDPSGLFALKFLLVNSDIHNKLGRIPRPGWFINYAYRKYIFPVTKIYIVKDFDMVSGVHVQIYPGNPPFAPADSAIVIVDGTSTFHLRNNPGHSYTRVNFKRTAQVRHHRHALASDISTVPISWTDWGVELCFTHETCSPTWRLVIGLGIYRYLSCAQKVHTGKIHWVHLSVDIQ